ncbi:MAG: hypothetical protein WCR97_00725 [Bacilli bacterium]
MITITILGLDPYLLRDISKDCTKKLADIYECKSEDIDFFSPEGLYVHEGVEQNTWNVLVRVHAPLKVKVMEKDAAKILHEYIKDTCVNMAIEFYYYSQDNRYDFLNKDHPRFMTEENTVVEDKEEFVQEEGEEPYLGNIFEDFNKKEK